MQAITKQTLNKLVITALLFLVAVAITVNCLASVNRYQNKVRALTYSGTDISSVPDGSYIGVCDVGFIAATVLVQVQNGQITQLLLLEHKNDRGAAAEVVIDSILQQQSLPVDTVSGATNSSKVIQKAVDNALLSAV